MNPLVAASEAGQAQTIRVEALMGFRTAKESDTYSGTPNGKLGR